MHLASVFSVFLLLTNFGCILGDKLGFDGQRQRKALIFGGNGFLGAEVVLRLIEEGFHVTTTNRGNWYWDNPVRVTTRVNNHFPCDRDDGVLNCWDLRNYIQKIDFFDLVVDFTAYSHKVVADTCKALNGKTGLYVLISSDSIYMVSKRDENVFDDPDADTIPIDLASDENRPWKEEHGTRPHSATLRERLQEKDPYGHDKLTCEEALVKQRQNGKGFPYVIFRLPDVLGGRDTTNRYWLYQIWLEYYQHIQVPLRFSYKLTHLKTSYVFVHDVARAMAKVIELNGTEVWDKTYNIAFEESVTLAELVKAIETSLKIEGAEYEFLPPSTEVEQAQQPIPGAIYLFPSVDFGAVDISRAKSVLQFEPTSFETAMANITAFYKWAFGKFPLQRDKAVYSLLYQLPEGNKEMFQGVLEQLTKRAELEVEESEKKPVKEEL